MEFSTSSGDTSSSAGPGVSCIPEAQPEARTEDRVDSEADSEDEDNLLQTAYSVSDLVGELEDAEDGQSDDNQDINRLTMNDQCPGADPTDLCAKVDVNCSSPNKANTDNVETQEQTLGDEVSTSRNTIKDPPGSSVDEVQRNGLVSVDVVNTTDDNSQCCDNDDGDANSLSSDSTVENEVDTREVDVEDVVDETLESLSMLRCRTLKHDYVNDPLNPKLQTLGHDYEPIPGETPQPTFTRNLPHDSIYENVDFGAVYPDEASVSDDGWDSAEFEPVGDASDSCEADRSSLDSSQDLSSPSYHGNQSHGKSVPPTLPKRNKSHRARVPRSPDVQFQSKMKERLVRLAGRNKKEDSSESDDEDSPVIKISINMTKHPPPQLGTKPGDLTPLQEKRRLIVSSIVETENSYVSSLHRIVEDYEKALLESDPYIIKKSDIRAIFYKVKDILQCHNMFQIELSETIKSWDQHEKIGSVFNGSFSKSLVFDVYSSFVNNFSVAMDTAKRRMTAKTTFADFLKQKLSSSPDKLSLFGLMVKPIQRFPQFILLLQDLLKHTPPNHRDRQDLQMALTELENLTHKLNETKRESESRHEAKRIISCLSGKSALKPDDHRYLVRQDDMIMTSTVSGMMKSKRRRLILLNDHLLCVSCFIKETDTMATEKYKLKWCIPVQEVQVIDSTFNTSAEVKEKAKKFSPPSSPPADHPHKKALDDLLHDLPIIEQINQLVTSLRFKYQTLTFESLQGITRHLQLLIRQKTDIDQCTIRLSLPTRSNRSVYTFQVTSPSQKQDWLLELKNAKLALDPANRPGWHLPEVDLSKQLIYKLPLFIKTLPVDITKPETKLHSRRSKKRSKVWIQCATPIVLPSHDQPGVGIQHLWVCSGEKGKGHTTIVSLHGGEPYAVESFRSSGAVCVCAEMVPGHSLEGDTFDDTVWIATEDKKLLVYNVMEENRRGPKLTFDTDEMVTYILYHEDHVYAGQYKGQLVIYTRGQDGAWSDVDREVFRLGSQPVSQLLVVSQQIWAACGNHIHMIHQVAPYINVENRMSCFIETIRELSMTEPGDIECMVKAGVGLIVSFRNKDLIRLYHLKTLDFLQDINMANVTRNYYREHNLSTDLKEGLKRLSVTCLQVSKGLLWIGTSVGCILSLPLPRLEGVPRISGRSHVSCHAHTGPIRFLSALHCGTVPLRPQSYCMEPCNVEEINDDFIMTNTQADAPPSESNQPAPGRNRGTIAKSADYTLNDRFHPSNGHHIGETLKSMSTPNLTEEYIEDRLEDLHTLYGSLMRGMDTADIEIEDYVKSPRHSRVSKMGKDVSHQMGKQVTKMSEAMMTKLKKRLDSKGSPKASTLPVLHEDGQSLSSTDGDSNRSSRAEYCAMKASDSDGVGTSEECFYENINGTDSEPTHDYENSEECRVSYIRAISAVIPEKKPPHVKRSHDRAIYPGVHLTSHLHSKAVVVVSGGDGHINWNDSKAQNSKYEDICLLLWQCRE